MDHILEGELVNKNVLTGDVTFEVNKIKQLEVKTTLDSEQLRSIYQYLQKGREEEYQIITIDDQIPIRLSKEETNQLSRDIQAILQ
ncbi:hypothetical protein LCL95_04060 [Bacillus timonensis]|nr:hypothetical protein [Bacillus timonensis]